MIRTSLPRWTDCGVPKTSAPSEAVNRLARAGLALSPDHYHLNIPGYVMSARVDYTSIADTLELLDGED